MGANLAIVASSGAFGGSVVLSTLFMQRVLGLSPLETGAALVPLALSALAGGFIAPRLIERLGTAHAVALSLVATAACLGWVAVAAGGAGYWAALFPVYCVAVARSPQRRCRSPPRSWTRPAPVNAASPPACSRPSPTLAVPGAGDLGRRGGRQGGDGG
jgi:hypothetical protein